MTNKNLYAVILAGGSGTRFWPLSRKSEPKQFLKIVGDKSLLQETLARIKPKVSGRNCLIVTNKDYQAQVKNQVAEYKIPFQNILLEPEGKNTAPAVCWAAAQINKRNKNAVMVVLPSDHLIQKKAAFLKDLSKAVKLAQQGYHVTFGIVPTRPETGYGYLKTKKAKHKGSVIYKIEKFVEKPNLAKAKQYVKSGRYLWNSGMFIWKCSVILDAFKEQQPRIYKLFEKKSGQAYAVKVWKKLPSVSVDYGIMEHARNVVTVPAGGIGWTDLGSWESLVEHTTKGKRGNIFKGDLLDVNSRNTLCWGGTRLIATIGCEDLVIVDTKDALLVCKRDQSQKVKEIVETLKKKKRKEGVSH